MISTLSHKQLRGKWGPVWLVRIQFTDQLEPSSCGNTKINMLTWPKHNPIILGSGWCFNPTNKKSRDPVGSIYNSIRTFKKKKCRSWSIHVWPDALACIRPPNHSQQSQTTDQVQFNTLVNSLHSTFMRVQPKRPIPQVPTSFIQVTSTSMAHLTTSYSIPGISKKGGFICTHPSS